MQYTIGHYTVEKFPDGVVKIHSERSVKDYFYIVVYFILALPILYLSFFISIHLVTDKVDMNTLFGTIIAICLLLSGSYFLLVSIETFIKPISTIFEIDKSKEVLRIRLNVFRRIEVSFSEIKNFKLGANDITIISRHDNRNYKKQLYILRLSVTFTTDESRKIHQFESPHLMISFNEKKKNKSLKEVSRQVSDLISKECDKKYIWTGTTKE